MPSRIWSQVGGFRLAAMPRSFPLASPKDHSLVGLAVHAEGPRTAPGGWLAMSRTYDSASDYVMTSRTIHITAVIAGMP